MQNNSYYIVAAAATLAAAAAAAAAAVAVEMAVTALQLSAVHRGYWPVLTSSHHQHCHHHAESLKDELTDELSHAFLYTTPRRAIRASAALQRLRPTGRPPGLEYEGLSQKRPYARTCGYFGGPTGLDELASEVSHNGRPLGTLGTVASQTGPSEGFYKGNLETPPLI